MLYNQLNFDMFFFNIKWYNSLIIEKEYSLYKIVFKNLEFKKTTFWFNQISKCN